MLRLEISLPDKILFSTRIPIRIGDINRAGHLSHVNLVQILEEARAQFMVSLGYTEAVNINRSDGFILADLAITLKKQAYYNQVLKVDIGVKDIQEKSFDLIYRVTDAANGTEVAVAKTAQLMFDYQSQKVTPLTEDLRNKLQA